MSRIHIFRPYVIAVVLALVYSFAVIAAKGSPLALVTVGTRFSVEAYNYSDEGYDGQFVYFIARDPASAPDLIAAGGDVPAYRFQRILLPALGWIVSLGGQDALVPFALLAINTLALVGGMWALQQILHEYRVSQWYALGCGLSLAWLAGTRLSLTEPLAYGLALGGLLLVKRERWLYAAILLALAALAKETTLMIAAGCSLYLIFGNVEHKLANGTHPTGSPLDLSHWLVAARFSLIVIMPFALWQIALRGMFGTMGVGSGGALATPFEIIPFAGVIRILTEGSPIIFVALMGLLLPFVLLPTLWGLWRCWQDARMQRVSLWTSVLFTTALVMLFVPFSTYREPLGILRFIAGLQIAVIGYAAERRLGRPLRYSVLWALTTLLVFMSDFRE